MHLFTWTKINTYISRPELYTPLLTATTTDQLVLKGQSDDVPSTSWILDTKLNKWEQLPVSTECDPACHLLYTTGLNNDVVLVCDPVCECNKLISSVMLGPRSLQQLAMRTIYGYRQELPWKSLPTTFISKLMGKLTK